MKEPPALVACLNLDGARLVVYEGGGGGGGCWRLANSSRRLAKAHGSHDALARRNLRIPVQIPAGRVRERQFRVRCTVLGYCIAACGSGDRGSCSDELCRCPRQEYA